MLDIQRIGRASEKGLSFTFILSTHLCTYCVSLFYNLPTSLPFRQFQVKATHCEAGRAVVDVVSTTYKYYNIVRGGVEGPAGTANAAPLFTVVRIAVPLFKAGRTGAANVPPRMRDCSAREYSTYAWASTVKLIIIN